MKLSIKMHVLFMNANIQAAENAFKFYNKHKMETDTKYFAIHFDRLKMVANEAKSNSKLVWKDISKYFHVFFSA